MYDKDNSQLTIKYIIQMQLRTNTMNLQGHYLTEQLAQEHNVIIK